MTADAAPAPVVVGSIGVDAAAAAISAGRGAGGPAHDLDRAATAPATRAAYHGALRRLRRWLWAHGYGDRLTDETLGAWVAAAHDAGAAPATIDQTVAAAVAAARLTGAPSPVGPLTTRRRRGARRTGAGRGRGQVTGITWRDADRMVDRAAGDGIKGLRDAVAIAVASDALLRVSEVAAITCSDLQGDGVVIKRAKGDQRGVGTAHYLGDRTRYLIATYRAEAGIKRGPLLRRIRAGGVVQAAGISAEAVRRLIVARARAVGLRGYVAGHSLRVGAAQSMTSAGATTLELQLSGRWRSPRMAAHYARIQRMTTDAVARRRYGH